VDPDTGLITPELLEAALARAPRARACFPAHLNGHVCDIAGLTAVAERHGLALVDDACHAIGARHADGAPVGDGKRTPLTAFSFHPVKSIAMGEGGAVTTDESDLARRCRLMRSHGMERDRSRFSPEMTALAADPEGRANGWVYEMDQPGYNYRAPDVLCALALSQLNKLDRFLARRRELAALYDRLLTPLAPAVRPVPHPDGGRSGWHLYAVLIDFEGLGRSRAAVAEDLAEAGVGTQVHYLPVHLQPYYRRLSPHLELPGALAYYARCLSLPFYPAMSEADVEHVAANLVRTLGLA
jgi:dTDP-4-amino-4,6-dideoxygalactose transaminase